MCTKAHEASVQVRPGGPLALQGWRPAAGSSLQAAPLDSTTVGGGGGSVVAELPLETGPRPGEASESSTVTDSVVE